MGTLLALGSCITIPVIGESNQNSFVFGNVVHIKNSISPRPQNAFQLLSYEVGESKWRTRFALNTSGASNNNGSQDNPSEENRGVGRTRLGIIVRAAGKQLLAKLNSARKNFPGKIFLLLLGFYTANALATILGQTGDWDVLVAGIVVAAIEGIGLLMYKKKTSKPVGKFQSFIVMVNYWKAGVCLGLFVDAFKLGS